MHFLAMTFKCTMTLTQFHDKQSGHKQQSLCEVETSNVSP